MTAPLSQDAFVLRFGGVYEHSAWIALENWKDGCGVNSAEDMARIFASTVDRAPADKKLALIRAHPDLAGRIALAGELTSDSMAEQASAGLDQCDREEFQLFQTYNTAYLEKFGFPFVMAVKDTHRTEILSAFAERLKHEYADEFATAIGEIHKIARLRLEQLF
jgi:2-oxo-4-hydroxy-4-carboxy-5-ureidoimidazoline decarboxylase